MAKTSASRPTAPGGRQSKGGPLKSSAGRTKAVSREAKAGQLVISKARFEAVMRAAEQSGLLREKSGRIAGRIVDCDANASPTTKSP